MTLTNSTVARGNAAEAAVLHAFVAADLDTFVPFGDGCPYDLAVDIPGVGILRIQVKSGRVRKGCIQFNTASTDHGSGIDRHYRDRADFIAVYAHELRQVYILATAECPERNGYLRIDPPRNWVPSIRMAEDHTFERWIDRMWLAGPLQPVKAVLAASGPAQN